MIGPDRGLVWAAGAWQLAGAKRRIARIDPDLNDKIRRRWRKRPRWRRGRGRRGVAAAPCIACRSGGWPMPRARRGCRLPVATAMRRELEKRGMLMRQHGLAFTPERREWLREGWALARCCRSKFPLHAERTVHRIARAGGPRDGYSSRRAPARRRDARPGAVRGRDVGAASGAAPSVGRAGRAVIAILGDDNSVALAIGLFGRMLAAEELPRRLTVLNSIPSVSPFSASGRRGRFCDRDRAGTICAIRSPSRISGCL